MSIRNHEVDSSGYVFPEGRVMPNTIFVGGVDTRIDPHEIKDFFSKFGAVKEVKIITDRSGLSKGYGFVSFNDEIDVQKIVDSQISFHGKRLKLGPAIRKNSNYSYIQPRTVVFNAQAPQYPNVWNAPTPDTYLPPTPMYSPVNPYLQTYTNSPVMLHQLPLPYQHPGYIQMSPQWPAGDQRCYGIPQQPLPWNYIGSENEPSSNDIPPAEYVQEPNSASISTNPQKTVDRSVQTMVSSLFFEDGKFQRLYFQEDYMKERRVHQFRRRGMFRPNVEKSDP